MSKSRKQELKNFLMEVKNLDSEGGEQQLDFCLWYEREYAVKCFEAIAFDQKRVAGYMRCYRNPDRKEEWFVGDIHVRNEYRGRNIATRLYEKTIATLKEYEAAEYVIAFVDKDNYKSIGLHEKVGFFDTHEKGEFANFYFEENETTFKRWLLKEYPVTKPEFAVEVLLDIWKDYKTSIGALSNEKELEAELMRVLTKAEEFIVVWCGNKLAGFYYWDEDEETDYLLDEYKVKE